MALRPTSLETLAMQQRRMVGYRHDITPEYIPQNWTGELGS